MFEIAQHPYANEYEECDEIKITVFRVRCRTFFIEKLAALRALVMTPVVHRVGPRQVLRYLQTTRERLNKNCKTLCVCAHAAVGKGVTSNSGE